MSAPPAALAVIAATLDEDRREPAPSVRVVMDLDVAGYDICARAPHTPADYRRAPAAPLAAPLTAGQREVLLLIAADLSNAAIGRRLWLSETAVKSRVKALFTALGVGTRLDAVLTAVEVGHVSIGELLAARSEPS